MSEQLHLESLCNRAFETRSLVDFWVLLVFFHSTVKEKLLHTPILSGKTTLSLALVMEKTSPVSLPMKGHLSRRRY